MKKHLLILLIATITLVPRLVWSLIMPDNLLYEALFSLKVCKHYSKDKISLVFSGEETLPSVVDVDGGIYISKKARSLPYIGWCLKENKAVGLGEHGYDKFEEKKYLEGWTLEESQIGSCRLTSGTTQKAKLHLNAPPLKYDFIVQGETLIISSFEKIDEETFRIKGIFCRSLLALEQNYILPPCQIVPFDSEVKIDETTTLWHLKVILN